jgi:hypothetical protein
MEECFAMVYDQQAALEDGLRGHRFEPTDHRQGQDVCDAGNGLRIRYWTKRFCLGDPSQSLRLSAIHP